MNLEDTDQIITQYFSGNEERREGIRDALRVVISFLRRDPKAIEELAECWDGYYENGAESRA